MADSKPELLIFEHLGGKGISVERLLRHGCKAMPLCLAQRAASGGVLDALSEVEVNLVSDEVIAEVHDTFMGDPTPTDVITFHHGEIFISVDTAEREGGAYGHSIEKETLLYLIHGLLHLNGHEDKLPEQREAMTEIQERILEQVWLGEEG